MSNVERQLSGDSVGIVEGRLRVDQRQSPDAQMHIACVGWSQPLSKVETIRERQVLSLRWPERSLYSAGCCGTTRGDWTRI
jgi:hypothetical protein